MIIPYHVLSRLSQFSSVYYAKVGALKEFSFFNMFASIKVLAKALGINPNHG